MRAKNIKEKYLTFFETVKGLEHKRIASAPLIPENDPTVLFTTAGMHPLVPFLLGQPHPMGKRVVDVQKCIRTGDIDEVGDDSHLTFFEMLGNWSFGDYFKEEAIQMSYDFLTKELGLSPDRLAVSVFVGDHTAPFDEVSFNKWVSLGIPRDRIAKLPKKNNWWGPAGLTGPCGPDTEMFYWLGNSNDIPKTFNDDNNLWLEIWNDVFMEYDKTKKTTILVDAKHCLFSKDFVLNQDFLDFITGQDVQIIIVANQYSSEAQQTLKETGLDVFYLNNEPNKKDPSYFTQLIEKYALNSEEVLYIDHLQENLDSASSAGIKIGFQYDVGKEATISKLKSFIFENLYYFKKLAQPNVDTGMGVERVAAVLQKKKTIYEIDSIKPIYDTISALAVEHNESSCRIITDHVRAAVFMLGDERGVTPSNLEQGYVLRKLIRRSIRHCFLLKIEDAKSAVLAVASAVITQCGNEYADLNEKKEFIISEFKKESDKFISTLEKGLKLILKKIQSEAIRATEKKPKSQHEVSAIRSEFEKSSPELSIDAKWLFDLFQSQGMPPEMTIEELESHKITISNKENVLKEFDEHFKKHQELSRVGAEKKFKGGLADNSAMTTKLHTATHLLGEALRKILGDSVKQRGSNITAERLRFDFNFERKLTPEELKAIEDLVNKKIQESLPVTKEKMKLQDALKSGAQSEFGTRYPAEVWVYSAGDFSKEICMGPHVKNSNELGVFKIKKEQSSAAGIRRIKAVVLEA